MIGRLNHVAIAVPDLMEASAQYKQMLGASVGEPLVNGAACTSDRDALFIIAMNIRMQATQGSPHIQRQPRCITCGICAASPQQH